MKPQISWKRKDNFNEGKSELADDEESKKLSEVKSV